MARFGLADDSDEEEIALNVEQQPDKAIHVDKSKAKAKQRVVSPPMDEDELPIPRPGRRQRPTKNALVEDEDGEYRYAKESRYQEDATDEEDEDEDEDEDDAMSQDEDDHTRMSVSKSLQSRPWPAQIGVEPHKVHLMQTSFFRMPEEEAAMKRAMQKVASGGKSKSQQHVDKLLSASARLPRKHSRGSDAGGLIADKAERMSFGQSVDPEPYLPARKVARVQGARSLSRGHEGSFIDAGLAFGRSFRVSWGPGCQIARIGGSSSSVVHIESVSMLASDEVGEDGASSRARLLLPVLLENSTTELDEALIPTIFPSRSLTFSAFASKFQGQNSHEAQVWREGVAIFDPIQPNTSAFIPPTIKHRLVALQRRTALGEWLATAVEPTVASAVLDELSPLQQTFQQLTGHQVETAVGTAMNDGNMNLAMLLSQAGGDAAFRRDLQEQLIVWAKEGVDHFVDEAYLKCIALLAGVTDVWRLPPGNPRKEAKEVNVVKGLDWKRAFGLTLWYGEGSEDVEGYDRALQQYERAKGRNGSLLPVPWYREASLRAEKSPVLNAENLDEVDGLLELLRLATGARLEDAIYPRAFSPNRLDYRMTWLLYMLLSRAMRLKDFSDRKEPGEDAVLGDEGHSATADNVTCAYATQLESLGLIQHAVFVLLHLEGSNGRKKAVKELLVRQAEKLEPWLLEGLVTLQIPIGWIEEAKACLAQYEGRAFDAYDHFLKAGEQRIAHEIAVNDLASDAVIREDFELLRALFKPFDPQAVDDWSFRGKLFLDYADVVERVPVLVTASSDNAVLDATDAAELKRYKSLIPQLIRLLPDVWNDRSDERQNAALSKVLTDLLLHFDNIKSKNGTQPPQVDAGLVDEATRLRHIHRTAYDRFMHAIDPVA